MKYVWDCEYITKQQGRRLWNELGNNNKISKK